MLYIILFIVGRGRRRLRKPVQGLRINVYYIHTHEYIILYHTYCIYISYIIHII